MTRWIAALTGLLLGAVINTMPAAVWGDRGHRIVDGIARELLNEDARQEITEIMGSDNLPIFALYMDKNKSELDAQPMFERLVLRR